MNRWRLLPFAPLSAVALVLAACGGGDDDSSGAAAAAVEQSMPAPSASGSTPAPPTVGVLEVEDLGTVLTDTEGQVLYVADEEAADPDLVCSGACEEFWAPAAAGPGVPIGDPAIGDPAIGDLAVAERPDGTGQLTLDGRRLYTFTLDDPGEAGGDGLSDTFDGQRFTWHAAVVGQTAAGPGDPVPAAGSGGGTSVDTAPPSDVFDYPGY